MAGSSRPALVEARGLCKRLGGRPVLQGVDLEIAQGSVHAVVGPPGAGKTTLLNVLTGYLAPDSGSVSFAGADVTGRLPRPRQPGGIARTLRSPALFDDLTAAEYAGSVGGSAAPARRCLGVRADVRLARLTPLERLALEIALALTTQPRLLVLDEPSAAGGLGQLDAVADLLRRAARGRTVLMVDHHLGLVHALADQVTVLAGGRMAAETADLAKF